MNRLKLIITCSIFAITFIFAAAVSAQEQKVDPEADAILKKMSDFMGSLKQFSAVTQNYYESILDSGQKVMFVNSGKVKMKRPGNLYAHRKGTIRNQDFYIHDGTITLYSRNLNMYATAKVPANVSEALDYASQELGLNAPGSDLFVDDIYAALMADVTSGIYLGKTELNGIKCHHVAFRSGEVDWQMWIEDGKRPIPRRYIITSKWLTGAPEYIIDILDFKTDEKISDKDFTFTPPKGAEKIAFLTKEQAQIVHKTIKKEISK